MLDEKRKSFPAPSSPYPKPKLDEKQSSFPTLSAAYLKPKICRETGNPPSTTPTQQQRGGGRLVAAPFSGPPFLFSFSLPRGFLPFFAFFCFLPARGFVCAFSILDE